MRCWPFSSRFDRRCQAVGLLTAVLLCLSPPASAEPGEADYSSLVDAVLEDYLQPAVGRFQTSIAETQSSMARLCAEPSEQSLAEARARFASAALAWSEIEYIDLDPWLQENRGQSIFFFPDRRGVTGRHLRAALQKSDSAQLDIIGQSSVALQGLPAMEYLLFGPGHESLIIRDGDGYRCELAEAVAGNLERLAGNLAMAWSADAPFVQALSAPASDNSLVRSHKEAATLLLGRVATGLEAMAQRKLSAPLGQSLEKARPLRAAYHLSGLTNKSLVANLKGLQRLQQASGMSAFLAPETAAALDPAYAGLLAELAALSMPLGEACADPEQRATVIAIERSLQDLHRLAGQEAMAELGLKVFFSADDGD